MENLAAGFAAYQMLQAEKSTLRDYTEFKADSDPVLVEIFPKKSEKRKHMYMGMVDDSGSLFGEIDYKKFATMPGVGKELNNLIIAVNNASGSAYSQADYDAYSQSTPQSTQGGRQEVPNKESRRVQYDSSSSQNAVDQMRKNAPKS